MRGLYKIRSRKPEMHHIFLLRLIDLFLYIPPMGMMFKQQQHSTRHIEINCHFNQYIDMTLVQLVYISASRLHHKVLHQTTLFIFSASSPFMIQLEFETGIKSLHIGECCVNCANYSFIIVLWYFYHCSDHTTTCTSLYIRHLSK